jgi:folate-dependent phosphoribosylglycinamide formyltransferase PurN
MNPVRVAFLTSIRDVGTDDRNGSFVAAKEGTVEMEGALERFVRETWHGGALFGLAELTLVITDDCERDMRTSDYPILPCDDRIWIHPLGLATGRGIPVTKLTRNIPSRFRILPKDATLRRVWEKRNFEEAVLAAMRETGTDILISDHYMARIDYLVEVLGLYGKVLNIHPAITVPTHEFAFPGKTPTADAIRRAQQEPSVFTGATLHIMNAEIDKGPPLALIAGTPVYADDEPQWLRYRNYQASKLPILIHGLVHYIGRIYPYLGSINLSSLEPRQER